MPWAYGITTKENGKQMIIDYHGKKVPGGIVDWLDNKGKEHHTKVPVYVIGDKKGYPKISIHGVLDDSRKNFVDGIKAARRRLEDFKEAKSAMRRNPRKFEKQMDAAVKEYYENNGLKGIPMKSAKKNGIPYGGLAGKIAKKALQETINKKAKFIDRHYGGLEGYYLKRKAHLDKKYAHERKEAKKGSMIYIDDEGHMRMGVLDIPDKERTENLYKLLRRGNTSYLLNAKGRKKVAKATHEKSLLNVYPDDVPLDKYIASKPWERMGISEKARHARKILGIKKKDKDPETKRKYTQKKVIQMYNALPAATREAHLPK